MSHQCPNCHSNELEYGGLQWFPSRVFEMMNQKPTVQDDQHPGQGALRTYTCTCCQTTFLEDPLQVTAV